MEILEISERPEKLECFFKKKITFIEVIGFILIELFLSFTLSPALQNPCNQQPWNPSRGGNQKVCKYRKHKPGSSPRKTHLWRTGSIDLVAPRKSLHIGSCRYWVCLGTPSAGKDPQSVYRKHSAKSLEH